MITSIGDRLTDNEVIVYANANTLNIKMDRDLVDATVSIYDFSGVLLHQIKRVNSQGQKWDTPFYQRGLFIVLIEGGNQVITKKFLNLE